MSLWRKIKDFWLTQQQSEVAKIINHITWDEEEGQTTEGDVGVSLREIIDREDMLSKK